MSQFTFRLQGVMKLRERERDTAADSYQQALLAIEKLEEEISRLLDEHAAQTPVQTDSSRGSVNAQRMLESQRFQLHILQEVQQLRDKVKLVEVEAEKRRQELVKREQAMRALEKLKEQQRQAWREAEQRNEQIAIDQWAGFRYWKEIDGAQQDV